MTVHQKGHNYGDSTHSLTVLQSDGYETWAENVKMNLRDMLDERK